jgi:SEC-C motif-containing protein
MENCPCNSGKSYKECCESFLSGGQIPQTPEALMRSRYTAYFQGNMDYVANTMKGPAAVGFNKEDAGQWSTQIKWHGLKVIKSKQDNNQGTVEFIARYALNGNIDIIYEISEFSLENGKWYYIDGVTPKLGRNDICPCGSQKKYKKCCGM